MASDFFRRMMLFSPEVVEERRQTGVISVPTMNAIMGGPPEAAVNPAQTRSILNRHYTASSYGIIQYSHGAGTSMSDMSWPSLNFGGTGMRRVASLGASMLMGPLAGVLTNNLMKAAGFTTEPTMQGSGAFLPSYLEGGKDEGWMYDHPGEHNFGDDLKPRSVFGTRRSGRGFAIGEIDMSTLGYNTDGMATNIPGVFSGERPGPGGPVFMRR